MNDMGSGNFRTFDPAKEEGAEPPQPRGNSLRDRIRRSEQAQAPAAAVSRSGYVHQPQQASEPAPAPAPQYEAPVAEQATPVVPPQDYAPSNPVPFFRPLPNTTTRVPPSPAPTRVHHAPNYPPRVQSKRRP